MIDTSLIYHHTRGPPFKASLKWLAQKWLNKEIQKPSTSGGVSTIGHDSEEDARAAIELVHLKLARGPNFGEFANDQESIYERLSREEPKVRTCMVDHGNPGQWHGAKADTAVACETDAEIAKGLLENALDHHFVFGRMLELSHRLGWSKPSNTVTGRTTAAAKNAVIAPETAEVDSAADLRDSGPEGLDAAYARLNGHIRDVYESLPINTAFIVMSGHRDPRKVLELAAKRNKFDIMFKTGTPVSKMDAAMKWTEEDDRLQATEIAKVREGMSFLAIKR